MGVSVIISEFLIEQHDRERDGIRSCYSVQ